MFSTATALGAAHVRKTRVNEHASMLTIYLPVEVHSSAIGVQSPSPNTPESANCSSRCIEPLIVGLPVLQTHAP